MKRIVVLILMCTTLSTIAGPRVVGNGFLKNKSDPIIQMENKLKMVKNNDERFLVLNELAKKYSAETFNINERNIKNVNENALSLLKLAESKNYQSLYADAIHHGNIVLGRAALINDDIDNAIFYLESAAKINGSAKLGSLGPNMTLVKELIKKGKRDSAIDYIDSSLKLWTDKTIARKKTSEWKNKIKEGGIPDFNENLEY